MKAMHSFQMKHAKINLQKVLFQLHSSSSFILFYHPLLLDPHSNIKQAMYHLPPSVSCYFPIPIHRLYVTNIYRLIVLGCAQFILCSTLDQQAIHRHVRFYSEVPCVTLAQCMSMKKPNQAPLLSHIPLVFSLIMLPIKRLKMVQTYSLFFAYHVSGEVWIKTFCFSEMICQLQGRGQALSWYSFH